MRAIKFRQWLSRYKRMEYGAGIAGPGHWQGFISVCFDIDPIMQFTGLLDCSGKGIYEGDILKGNVTFENSEEYPLVKVLWNNKDSAFELRLINGSKGWIPTNWIDTYRIIGNIYENPELLEV